jgi:hypothetical protein
MLIIISARKVVFLFVALYIVLLAAFRPLSIGREPLLIKSIQNRANSCSMLLSNLFSQRVSRCYRVTTPLIELYARTISSKMSSSVPPSDRASEDIETFHQFSLQSDIQRALSDLSEKFVVYAFL